MRVTLQIIEQRVRRGTSARTKRDYAMHTIRGIEVTKRKVKLRDPIEVSLSDDDIDLEGQLEGQTISVDLMAVKAGQFGVEFKGAVVREAVQTAGTEDLSETAKAA